MAHVRVRGVGKSMAMKDFFDPLNVSSHATIPLPGVFLGRLQPDVAGLL